MEPKSTAQFYNCIIIGGGLAGLSLSILLAQKKYAVLLLEKKSYPYHKVCGEYISNESRNFLTSLGIPIDIMNLPEISKLQITSTQGNILNTQLDTGGFGISRYTLDKLMCDTARSCGVTIMEDTNCNQYKKENGSFTVQSSKGNFAGKILCAAFGRHASGNFFKPMRESENWVAVKYHIQYDTAPDTISLHTFKDGYCGISKVEGNTSCLCYLVKASLLKKYHNKIEFLEKNELKKNPALKEILSNATFLYEKPLTVSNITFDVKQAVVDGVFYIGDSAGSIAPLTGNGMSNAMRSAWMLSEELQQYFENKISISELETNYRQKWTKEFASRIRKGRLIQHLFCSENRTSLLITLTKALPFLKRLLIRQTHGASF